MWNDHWHMKVTITFTFCCNNVWKSIVYGSGKSLENSGKFFLPLRGHRVITWWMLIDWIGHQVADCVSLLSVLKQFIFTSYLLNSSVMHMLMVTVFWWLWSTTFHGLQNCMSHRGKTAGTLQDPAVLWYHGNNDVPQDATEFNFGVFIFTCYLLNLSMMHMLTSYVIIRHQTTCVWCRRTYSLMWDFSICHNDTIYIL